MDKYKKKENWKSIVSIILVVLLSFGVFAGFSVLFKKESKPSGNNVKAVSCMDTFVNTKLADYTKLDFEFAGKGLLTPNGEFFDPWDYPFYSTELISLEGYDEMIIKVNPSFFYDKVTLPDLDIPDTYSDWDPLLFLIFNDEGGRDACEMSALDCNLVAIFGEYSFVSIKPPEGAEYLSLGKVSLVFYEKAKDVVEIWVK